jgi:hypothetical protein
MKIEEKIEKYLKEGHLSWSDTDDVVKKLGGKYKEGQEKGKGYHNTYVFKNIDNLQAFSDVMKKKFMTFKADPDGLEVKVWF